MAKVKQKKKRNKAYRGSGAAMTRSHVTRISAVQRSKAGQWWFEHKRIIRFAAIGAAVAIVIILLITGIVGLFR